MEEQFVPPPRNRGLRRSHRTPWRSPETISADVHDPSHVPGRASDPGMLVALVDRRGHALENDGPSQGLDALRRSGRSSVRQVIRDPRPSAPSGAYTTSDPGPIASAQLRRRVALRSDEEHVLFQCDVTRRCPARAQRRDRRRCTGRESPSSISRCAADSMGNQVHTLSI